MFKDIPDNIKTPILAVTPLLGVLILFLFVAKFGFAKISEVRLQTEKAVVDENILINKLEILNRVTDTIEQDVNILTSTLPYTNPALVASSQVKLISAESGVGVFGLKSSAEATEEGLSKITLNFEVVGPRAGVFVFLSKLNKASPLMLIEKVTISETSGEIRSTVALKSFWSPLPTKLPALTDQINGLTDQEEELVGEILTYQQPIFVNLPPSTETGRTDPFTP